MNAYARDQKWRKDRLEKLNDILVGALIQTAVTCELALDVYNDFALDNPHGYIKELATDLRQMAKGCRRETNSIRKQIDQETSDYDPHWEKGAQQLKSIIEDRRQ